MKTECDKLADLLGVKIEQIIYGQSLTEGEKFIAHRNHKPVLLTCMKDDLANGWVLNKECQYAYDRHECFRIVGNLPETVPANIHIATREYFF